MPSLVFELAQVYHISRERARGFLKKVEKSFWCGEAQPLRAAHGAPLARREPARGHENVANVGMLPVPMLPMANGGWGRTSPVACHPIFPPPRWRFSRLGGRAGARPSQRERCHGVCGCGSHATGHWIVPPLTVEIESGSRHPLANPCGTLR